ncbi:MAG: heavy-metal-associated domain-containing protein [Ignavibacteriae bacterium]|nr:heavy-metal-associated domain-containing protein [Ignavibacteriota bacterium]
MKLKEIIIHGMTCQHCVMAVKKELGKLHGATIEHVEIGKARLLVEETMVTDEMLAKAIEEAGYTLQL